MSAFAWWELLSVLRSTHDLLVLLWIFPLIPSCVFVFPFIFDATDIVILDEVQKPAYSILLFLFMLLFLSRLIYRWLLDQSSHQMILGLLLCGRIFRLDRLNLSRLWVRQHLLRWFWRLLNRLNISICLDWLCL